MSHNIQDDMGKATRRRQLPKRRHSRTPCKRYQQQGGLGETHVVFDFDCTLTTHHVYYSLINQKFDNNTLASTILNTDVVPGNETTLQIQSDNAAYNIHETIQRIFQWIIYCNTLSNNCEVNQAAELALIKQQIINYFFGGQERFNKLTEFFQLLIHKNVTLHIASRGNRKIILSMLRIIGWSNYFTDEHVDANYDDTKPYISKDKYILNLLNNSDSVYYFDDDNLENDTLTEMSSDFTIKERKPLFNSYTYKNQTANYTNWVDQKKAPWKATPGGTIAQNTTISSGVFIPNAQPQIIQTLRKAWIHP